MFHVFLSSWISKINMFYSDLRIIPYFTLLYVLQEYFTYFIYGLQGIIIHAFLLH